MQRRVSVYKKAKVLPRLPQPPEKLSFLVIPIFLATLHGKISGLGFAAFV